jgi:hypothetical protein
MPYFGKSDTYLSQKSKLGKSVANFSFYWSLFPGFPILGEKSVADLPEPLYFASGIYIYTDRVSFSH